MWGRKLSDLESSHGERLSALELAASALPSIEGTVDDIKLEVNKLSKHWDRAVLERAPQLPLCPIPPAPERLPAPGFAGRPNGHHVDLRHQEDGHGVVTAMVRPPVKGTSFDSSAPRAAPPFDPVGSRWHSDSHRPNHANRIPKLQFPEFDGSNPKLWISRCEDYFDICDVESGLWIKVATMHFAEPASPWLQSVERKLRSCSWSEFCSLLLERFGRDHHELLVRQMLHIRQSGPVSEYIQQFSTLVDQLAAYEGHIDQLHYTMRFIDGLQESNRSVVLLQRPSCLDTTFVLAQLQEEVAAPSRPKEFKKWDSFSAKPSGRQPLPLPPPPTKWDRPGAKSSDDRRGADYSKPRSADDKWGALRSFRRAKGLCERCAVKWSKDHKCAESVQLHAVQELLELFSTEDLTDSQSVPARNGEDQLFLTISVAALSGKPAPKTLCLKGLMQNHDINILLDSGSSHSFISDSLASKLQGVSTLQSALSVQVANGARLTYCAHLPHASWSVNGYEFISDLKILSMSSYEMILGMDWLEAFSPMKIHWKHKWISLPYNGDTVYLFGNLQELSVDSVIQVCSVEVSVTEGVSVSIPVDIQHLIEEFSLLFEVPLELPPPRACDHSIPLIAGAALVQVRPYRFAPALKDEIESQIKEMLDKGLIQKSTSPFSSAVLLVKKKDGTWRFCVDYPHLNAITIKRKYPVPIIDEFLDELSKASWFSCLDLRAGFHQIRLKPGEECKTTFQTHNDHVEFRVMAFGLTGAPGSFQEAMNSTLSPYLRKFVLVFFDDILIYSSSYEEHVVHLRLVFELLAKKQWRIKLSKCSFAQREIKYVGHVISERGVSTDPSKISAIA